MCNIYRVCRVIVGQVFDDLFKNHYWRDFKLVVFSAVWKGTRGVRLSR